MAALCNHRNFACILFIGSAHFWARFISSGFAAFVVETSSPHQMFHQYGWRCLRRWVGPSQSSPGFMWLISHGQTFHMLSGNRHSGLIYHAPFTLTNLFDRSELMNARSWSLWILWGIRPTLIGNSHQMALDPLCAIHEASINNIKTVARVAILAEL